jgi:hypothetical protein
MYCKSIDLRIARVAKENLEPKESAVVEDVDDNRGNPRVMAMLAEPYSDTYAIVNNNGDAITADESSLKLIFEFLLLQKNSFLKDTANQVSFDCDG